MDTQLNIASIVDILDIPARSQRKPIFDIPETAQIDVDLNGSTGSPFLSLIKVCVLSAVVLLHASCVTLTDDERIQSQYDREDKLIVAREDYARRSADCRRNGGAMQITKRSLSRISKPTVHEYKFARCIRY